MSEKGIDQAKLMEFMKNGWSYMFMEQKAVLTEEDKEDLANQVTKSLGAEIVNGVAVIGRQEVSE